MTQNVRTFKIPNQILKEWGKTLTSIMSEMSVMISAFMDKLYPKVVKSDADLNWLKY